MLHGGKGTASVESCAIILHGNASDAVFEGFVEFAETADDEVDEIVHVGVGLLLAIGCLNILLGVLLTDPEEVVNCIVHYLDDFLGNELFLSEGISTSP